MLFRSGSGDTTFSAGLNTSTNGTLTKNGTGTLTLSAAGSYTGATTVNAGIVDVKNNTALGTSAGATTVASNAAVQIDGSGLSIAEPFTLTGTGVSTAGAIRNLANNNTLSGLITLSTSAVRINSDSGTLTLDVSSGNAITATNINVTFGGSGNITVAEPIATGTGTLTKDGSGTLTLSGANTYTGITTISAGTLAATVNDALGTSAAGTTVASGATLDLQNVKIGRAHV